MNVVRFFHTVKYLKPVQIYGRLWFKLYRPRKDLSLAPDTRKVTGEWTAPCQKPVSLLTDARFTFLNVTHALKRSSDWNHTGWDKLWLYNLHYFDGLQARDGNSQKSVCSDLIEKWVRENPPGLGNGWEPYPTSLRMVNWIKWALAGNVLSETALHSLAVQARWLFKKLEYHLLGNHLFANAKALMFAGLFFGGKEADGWFQKGLGILDTQVDEQILADGGHFERTPMYHSIILEDLLDLLNLMNAYCMAGRVPDQWRGSIDGMVRWLAGMCHPDGRISFFNDAAWGVAPVLADLKAYALRLGFVDGGTSLGGVVEFPESGYVRLENRRSVLIADVGDIGPDYLPGHAHADTLSFEWSVRGQRILVNSGISCYGTSKERLAQRGTASHNTLVLGDQNSSDVWSGFRVGQRARPLGLEVTATPGDVRVRCGHDGYARLCGRPVHWREWRMTDDGLEVRDQVTGGGFRGRVYYHLYPGARVDLQAKRIRLGDIDMVFRTEDRVALIDTCYYPEFGKVMSNLCLVLESDTGSCAVKFILKDEHEDTLYNG